MHLSAQLIVLLSAALVATIHALPIEPEDSENSVIVATNENTASGSSSNSFGNGGVFVKISKAPPARVAQPVGSTVELECEVVGSPSPVVQWVSGSGRFATLDDYETNVISDSDPAVMTTARSRLVIDRNVAGEHTFTCIGRAGSQTAYASTVVHKAPRHLMKPENQSALPLSVNLRPVRILNYFKSVLAFMGSTLIIPCKVYGKPRAEVTWFDNNDSPITGEEARFKTLPTGELLISNLKWADMGSFTCIAKNGFSKDSIETFIYPLRED